MPMVTRLNVPVSSSTGMLDSCVVVVIDDDDDDDDDVTVVIFLCQVCAQG
jgi:hypothetical protein